MFSFFDIFVRSMVFIGNYLVFLWKRKVLFFGKENYINSKDFFGGFRLYYISVFFYSRGVGWNGGKSRMEYFVRGL